MKKLVALLSVLITAAAPALAEKAPPASAVKPKVKKVKVLGTELAYVQQGTGDPVVFVHGSLGDLNTFGPQLEPFSKRFRVIAYSRRFHPPNKLPASDSPYSATLHADDLAAMLKALKLEPAHIVASSYGAYTALMLAKNHPSVVRSLVLGEPPAFPLIWNTAKGASVFKDFEAKALAPARRAFGKGDLEDGLRQFIDGVSDKKGAFDQIPAPGRAELMTYAKEMRLELLTDPARYLPALSCDDLKAMPMPVLLVTGDSSASMFHLITDELERCLPTKERVTIPKAGHSMHLANPATYNEQVLTFLSKR